MQILPFNFEENEIRTVAINEKPFFVAKDVAQALGYAKPENAINRHCKLSNTTPKRGGGFLTVIPEPDVYRLIIKSRLPAAERFEAWIMEEVLPTIRKTNGAYLTEQKTKELINNPDLIIELAQTVKQLRAERDEIIRTKAHISDKKTATALQTASAATRKANNLEIRLDQSKQYITVKRMSMIHHGQTFDWKELKSISAEMRLLPKKVFDQNYGSVNAYHADVWREVYAISATA